MRIGIIAPRYFPVEGGNAVTVHRIERHLRALGCEVQAFAADSLPPEEMLEGLKRFRPQLLHAFHGYHCGRLARALAEELQLPYLVTLTGTDVYQALSDQRSHAVHQALRGAARLVAFDVSVKRHLAEHLPSLEERTAIIPQGVELPEIAAVPDAADTVTFLLPAGIRPVKNVLFPLQPFRLLHAAHPAVRLLLVGPILDTAYAAEMMEALEGHPCARYLGVVEHEAMGELYRSADVVLNSSFIEGGMANSVLEALAQAKALLVSDIEGNRSLIKEGVTGLLYRDVEQFLKQAERLVADPALRARLGENGRALVREQYPPEKEAQAYLELYRSMLS
jgi:glycosyltransferase involved in cell wall biosynthesis